MKQVFFAVMTILCVASILSCDNTRITTLEGRVVDGQTGKPVSGIKLGLSAEGKNQAGEVVVSKIDGHISMSVETEGRSGTATVSTSNAFFFGYFERHFSETDISLQYGETNNLDIPLEPKDAWLRMHLKNESNPDGKIYGYITGPSYWKHMNGDYFDTNPLIVKQGDSTIYLMKVGSGQNVQVKLYGKSIGPIPAIPTGIIYCPRFDTTDIFLKL